MSLFFQRPEPAREEQRQTNLDAFIHGDDLSGTTLRERALRLTPVYAAVSLLADGVASLPLQAYRTAPDGSRQRTDTPSLFKAPAATGTVYDWVHRAMVSLLLRGNAYGYITSFDNAGWPSTIEWLDPDCVQVEESTGIARYFVNGRAIDRSRMVHVVGFARPGSVVGVSPIEQYAMTLDMGLTAQKSARDWFKNGVTPMTDITVGAAGGNLSDEVAQSFKSRYKANVRSGDPFIHGENITMKSVGVSASDARFLEAITASATHIAAIYHVAPEDIGGETGSSLTYSTTELNEIKFQTRSLRPWVTRLEQVFSTLTPQPVYMRFNFDANIRTDVKTRWETHKIALDTGARTVNEIRRLEDLPPVEWGDRQPGDAGSQKQRNAAETIQKLYLGVGKVITSDEARLLANEAGADLAIPGPDFTPPGGTP